MKPLFLLGLLLFSLNPAFARAEFYCESKINWFTDDHVYQKTWILRRTDSNLAIGAPYHWRQACEEQKEIAKGGLACSGKPEGGDYFFTLYETKTGRALSITRYPQRCQQAAAIGVRHGIVCATANDGYSLELKSVNGRSFNTLVGSDSSWFHHFHDHLTCLRTLESLSPVTCEDRVAPPGYERVEAIQTSDGKPLQSVYSYKQANEAETARSKCERWAKAFNTWLSPSAP